MTSSERKCQTSSFSRDEEDEVSSFREGVRLPTQGESLVRGVDTPGLQLQERERDDGPPDFMFLSVILYPTAIALAMPALLEIRYRPVRRLNPQIQLSCID